MVRSSVISLGLIWCLTGCQNGLPEGLPILSESRMKEEKTYSMPEIMLIVATERNRYEQVYTNEIWKVTVDEDGTLFQTYLMEQINGFLEEVCTLNLLAAERGITLSEQEKERLRQLSAAYYESLTDADKTYIQAGPEEIYQLYHDYHLANQMMAELLLGVDLEVSDSDAKVIRVMEMVLGDQESADAAYQALQEEGADFAAVASQYSLTGPAEIRLTRGEREVVYDNTVFSLDDGQVSEVVQAGDYFYIIRCLNAYDEKETAEHKEELYRQRKSQAFRQLYQQYATRYSVEFDDTPLKALVFAPEDGTTTTVFFTLYQEHMNQ
jgi:PPIC-type PPIASE domain.